MHGGMQMWRKRNQLKCVFYWSRQEVMVAKIQVCAVLMEKSFLNE